MSIPGLSVVSHVAWGAAALVRKGIAAHGVPQRLLTDNDATLRPSCRAVVSQLSSIPT